MLQYSTAGESHGRALMTIVEGMPAGVPLRSERIDAELRRRQLGYGRGGRMSIERDRATILAGVRKGYTLGSPVGLLIRNRDWKNWREVMDPAPGESPAPIRRPRPGHADLAGALKYGHQDLRNVLERASARETAARVAAGAVAGALLDALDIRVMGWTAGVGSVTADPATFPAGDDRHEVWLKWREREGKTSLRCPDAAAEERMVTEIDAARRAGDTLGGVVEVRALGVPVGLGSYVSRDRRLDARLAAALMAIPGIKAVEMGDGFSAATLTGSHVHDVMRPRQGGVTPARPTNRAGGLEGGVSNGEPIIVRAYMKPIATMRQPTESVDLDTGEAVMAHHERSDVCAVPAAGVVAEAAVALSLADAVMEKFGGDSLVEIERALTGFLEGLR
ncbi:MAG: chorismate synthase [Clostridia bacterium]